MNHPSSNALMNTVDVYPFAAVLDADGTVVADLSYPSTPSQTAVPCSVQLGSVVRDDTTLDRTQEVRNYDVLFGSDPGLKVLDKLVWTDSAGEILFVDGSVNMAGRFAAWCCPCVERR